MKICGPKADDVTGEWRIIGICYTLLLKLV